jgi:hypothetical protein
VILLGRALASKRYKRMSNRESTDLDFGRDLLRYLCFVALVPHRGHLAVRAADHLDGDDIMDDRRLQGDVRHEAPNADSTPEPACLRLLME